jgi:large subunit ribosomal protein L36
VAESHIAANKEETHMKVKASVKKRSEDDIIVKRKGKIYVINKKIKRHNQRQG